VRSCLPPSPTACRCAIVHVDGRLSPSALNQKLLEDNLRVLCNTHRWGATRECFTPVRCSCSGLATQVLLSLMRPRDGCLLQARNYSIAWQLAAANRVDLNALVDFAYPAVLDDVEAFVAAAPSTSDLCDLLAALSPASVTRQGGLYAEMQLSAAALQVEIAPYSRAHGCHKRHDDL